MQHADGRTSLVMDTLRTECTPRTSRTGRAMHTGRTFRTSREPRRQRERAVGGTIIHHNHLERTATQRRKDAFYARAERLLRIKSRYDDGKFHFVG